MISVGADSSMVPLGLGMHLSDVDPANLTKIGLLSNVASTFSMLAAVLSKTSFAVTLLRITNGYTKTFVWFAIVIMNLGMGLAALFVWVKCNPVRKTWDFSVPGTCLDSHAMTVYSVFAAGKCAPRCHVMSLLYKPSGKRIANGFSRQPFLRQWTLLSPCCPGRLSGTCR